jgi:hypothetical protein
VSAPSYDAVVVGARWAMQGNQAAIDAFVSVQASTLPAPEFFAPENVERIIGAARVAS